MEPLISGKKKIVSIRGIEQRITSMRRKFAKIATRVAFSCGNDLVRWSCLKASNLVGALPSEPQELRI